MGRDVTYTMTARNTPSASVRFALAAIGMLLAIILAMQTVGLGDARRFVEEGTTVYLLSRGVILYAVAFASIPFLLGCAVAVRGGVFWLFSAPLFLGSAAFLGVVGPTVWGDRVEVSASHFWTSHGLWFAPIEQRVDFAPIQCIEVRQQHADGPAGPSYDLACHRADSREAMVVPLGDLVRVALPEIAASARAAGVTVVGDTQDGLPVSPPGASEPSLDTKRGFEPQFLLTVLPGFAAIAVALLLWGRRHRRTDVPKNNSANTVCYGLYMGATVVLAVATLPDDNGINPDIGLKIDLVLAGILLATGALGHVILWMRGQLPPFREHKRLIALTTVIGPVVFGINWLDNTPGLYRIGFVVLGALAAALIAAYLWASWYLRRLPMNRMAILMQQGDYGEAITLGEAQPVETRPPAVTLNLATSYSRVGRYPEARQLLADLQAQSDLPNVFREPIDRLSAELQAESTPTSLDAPTQQQTPS